MIHIGDKDYTIAIPGAKKIYQGSNFIGLAKGDEPPAQENNEEESNEQEKEEE